MFSVAFFNETEGDPRPILFTNLEKLYFEFVGMLRPTFDFFLVSDILPLIYCPKQATGEKAKPKKQPKTTTNQQRNLQRSYN